MTKADRHAESTGPEPEEPLSGGRLTPGVVRIGSTVRRPHKASSPFVARLLDHLAAEGCEWAPRYCGQDESGRDVLTYLPGEVPAKWRQFPDDQVSAAARIVRDLHDRTTHSTLTAASSVVCHNDLGPNNFVFRNGSPIALIDYDMAAPGERLEDLGYMAWAWCLSSKATRGSVRSQAQQVLVLADAYGLSAAERGLLPDAIIKRQRRNTQFWRAYLTQQTEPAISTPEHVRDVIAWSNTEMSHTIVHRDVLLATLKPLSRAKR